MLDGSLLQQHRCKCKNFRTQCHQINVSSLSINRVKSGFEAALLETRGGSTVEPGPSFVCVPENSRACLVLSMWEAREPGVRSWGAASVGRGFHGVPSVCTLHAGGRNLSSKALLWNARSENWKEDALISAVSNMWHLQTINIFNGFNSYYFGISLLLFTASEDQTANTLLGMVLCCHTDLLNLTKKFNRTYREQTALK